MFVVRKEVHDWESSLNQFAQELRLLTQVRNERESVEEQPVAKLAEFELPVRVSELFIVAVDLTPGGDTRYNDICITIYGRMTVIIKIMIILTVIMLSTM